MKIDGIVESKSRAGTGIKVEGKWYNGTKELLSTVDWQDTVSMEVEGNTVQSIQAAKPVDATTGKPIVPTDRNAVITFQACRNASIELLGKLIESSAMSLPAKQANKYDAVMAFINTTTVEFYEQVERVGHGETPRSVLLDE